MAGILRIVETPRRRIGALLAVILLSVGFAALAAARLRVDSAITELLPSDSATRSRVERYAPDMADTEPMPIVLHAANLLTVSHMSLVAELMDRLERLDGVTLAATPFSVVRFETIAGRLLPRPLAPDGVPPRDEGTLRLFRERLAGAASDSHSFVANDGTSMTVLLSVEPRQSYSSLLNEIDSAMVETLAGSDVSTTVGGFIPIYVETEQRVARDLPLLGSIGAALAIALLVAVFGWTPAVLLPVVAVTVSVLWTLGLMALTGTPVTVVTLMLPPLLFALGSSYGVHLISGGGNKIVETAETIAIAALTTAAGFFSLVISGLPSLRQFGVFAGIGILVTAGVTVLLAMLLASRKIATAHVWLAGTLGGAGRAAAVLANSAARHGGCWATATVAALAIMCVLVVAGDRDLRYQTDVSQLFRADSPSVQANRRSMATFGSFVSLQLTATQPRAGAFPSPELLAAMDRFESLSVEHADIAGVSSVAAQLRAMNMARSGHDRLPDNSGAIQLLLRLLGAVSAGDQGSATDGLMKAQQRQMTSQLWVLDAKTKWLLDDHSLQQLVDHLERSAERAFAGTPFEAELWGWSLVTLQVSQILAREQLMSIAASAGIVLLLVAIAFRSLLTALAAMVPLTAGIGLTYAVLALLSIPVDAITISFASIAIGVGVDDAVHLLLHFRRRLRAGDVSRLAARSAVQTAGRAILITSVAVIVGLGALAVSAFLPIAYLGLLVAVTLVGTTAAALGILPTLVGARRSRGLSQPDGSQT